MLAFTSNFITDMDTFDKQKPDKQISKFFSWWSELNKIKDGKNTRIRSYSIDYAYIYYKSVNKTIGSK